MTDARVEPAGLLKGGWAALDDGRWAEARDLFQEAVDADPTPEGLEGLGLALFWTDDPRTIEVREEAYRRFRQAGDPVSAARVAVALSWDHLAFRGEEAVATGWLELAGRLLPTDRLVPEHAWLALQWADHTMSTDGDPGLMEERAERAIELARQLGLPDVEFSAMALSGAAMVNQGRVADGMRRLDAAVAAAMAGEITDVAQAGYTCCYLIVACERVRDFPRAAQWCAKAVEYCKRWTMMPLFHYCRAHYAGMLVEQGRWPEAEATMLAAAEGLAAARPAIAVEALVRLAELRRRQGRFDEAAALFDEIGPWLGAMVGRALLELDRGDPVAAADIAERFLRALGPGERARAAGGLEVLVHARAAIGDVAGARAALADLAAAADLFGTLPLRAATALATAVAALAAGEIDAARCAAEDAVDAHGRAGAPYGAASARVVLAQALAATGRFEAAAREAATAATAFEHLGAVHAAERARRAVPAPAPGRVAGATGHPSLTPREREVLALVAEGLSDADIAARLVLSRHTVHRHVANILTKLGVPTRAAAIARAAVLDQAG